MKYTVNISDQLNKNKIKKLFNRNYIFTEENLDNYDVTLVNTIKKLPDSDTIELSSKGNITNRIINLTNNLTNISRLRDFLKDNDIYNLTDNIQYNKTNTNDYTTVVIFLSNDKLYSAHLHGSDSENIIMSKLISVCSGTFTISNPQNTIITGNIFNEHKLGAFQVYRVYWHSNKIRNIKVVKSDNYDIDEEFLIKTYFDELSEKQFESSSMNNVILNTIQKGNFTMLTVSLLNTNKKYYTLVKGTFFDYIGDAYRNTFNNYFESTEITTDSGAYLPRNKNYNILMYKKSIIKDNKLLLDDAINNSNGTQNIYEIRNILSDKIVYFDALKYISKHLNLGIVAKNVKELIDSKKNVDMYKKIIIPFTDKFNINDPDIKEKLNIYLKHKNTWLFKPSMGTQGKGIFIFKSTSSKSDYDKLYKLLRTEIDNNTSSRSFDTWQISQFIDNPLLFNPFKSLNKQEKSLLGSGGRKSHVRFYMSIIEYTDDNGKKKMKFYMLPHSFVFLAVLPYSRCRALIKKKKLLYREEYMDELSGNMVIDPNKEMDYCNQSNLTLGGYYFKTRNLENDSYDIFSERADIAFDRKFRKDYYKDVIYPKLENIGKLTMECTRLCRLNKDNLTCSDNYSNLCNNDNCFQFMAIDVMFDDGRYSDGEPQPFILEANMTPGLRGPSRSLGQEKFEEMLANLLEESLGVKPAKSNNKVQSKNKGNAEEE